MSVTREGTRMALMRANVGERLRQGIAQGIFQEEVANDLGEVLRQLDENKEQISSLQANLSSTSKELDDFKRIYRDAGIAYQREKQRAERFADLKRSAAFTGVVFGIVLASTFICKLIIG